MNTTGAQVKFSTMLHRPGQAAALGVLAALLIFPASALAQTGISEADVIQQEEEKEGTEQDGIDITERDAVTTRPSVSLTTPGAEAAERFDRFDDGLVSYQLRTATRLSLIDNLDFRDLSDTDDNIQDQFDSDDRRVFGVNNIVAGIEFKPSEQVKVNMGLRHNTLWGGGRFSSLNSDNALLLDLLFLEWTPLRSDSFSLTTRVGRQYYEIGGAGEFGGAKRDYFFWDVVDGITIDVGMGKAGKLRLLGLDLAGSQFRPDEVDFYTRSISPSSDTNFRGQAVTTRHGLVYENTDAVEGLEVRAFGFLADIGAGSISAQGTAADLCYAGTLCNFTDNDYNWMAGTRIGYFFENETETFEIGAYGEFAQSGGIDRKDTRVGLYNVGEFSTSSAFGGGLLSAIDLGSLDLGLGVQYFRADGPLYGEADGILFDHGFVSFKGAHVGGGVADDAMGWHPSAYVSATNGVDSGPQEQSRRSGTQSIHAGLDVGIMSTVDITLGAWFFSDTGQGIEEENLEARARDLPFGYTLADLLAQQRLGKSLGTELDAGVALSVHEQLKVFSQGGIFLPGEFYQGEISRTGGTALGSDNPTSAWMVMGGMAVEIK